MAELVSTRGTCVRRKVGCVLVDKRNHVLSTGYNGPASGLTHCIEEPCQGSNLASGTGLDSCEALHGEMNAILQCKDVYEIETCYTTTAPCITCTKLLMNTSCKRIVFREDYPHSERSKELWWKKGRAWCPENLLIRFNSFVILDKATGCWNWGGGLNKRSGRGTIKVNSKMIYSSRLSYELFIGKIPDGLFVLHNCDNTACVNPKHFFTGTQLDNVRDMINKGRQKYPTIQVGENHWNSKLTEEIVKQIRNDSRPYPIISKEYGVSSPTICNIKKGKQWKHLFCGD
jgi:dCMP deaminase